MSEDRAGLVVERPIAILTEISLIDSVAAVSDRAVRTAVGTFNTVSPANLCRIDSLRLIPTQSGLVGTYWAPQRRCPCPLRLSATVLGINNLLHKSESHK